MVFSQKYPFLRKCVFTAGFLCLLLFCVFFLLRRILLWKGIGVCVDNRTKDISISVELTDKEMAALLNGNDVAGLKDICGYLPISKVRSTHKGYYARVDSGSRTYLLFFDRKTKFCNWISFPELYSVEKAHAAVPYPKMRFSPLHGTIWYSSSLPHYRLNTGSEYQVFYYSDGVEIVWYTNPVEYGEFFPKKVRTISYAELLLNPFFRWSFPYEDIMYIRKIDR